MDISVVMVELIYRIENCEESGGSCSVMYRDLSMFQVLFVACLEKKVLFVALPTGMLIGCHGFYENCKYMNFLTSNCLLICTGREIWG
jgi:hypothetical protein